MKRNSFFYCVWMLSLITLVGCKDNDENSLEDVIKQTQWKGTLTNKNTVSVAIVFNDENSGYYIIDDESFGFSYYRDNRIVQISGYNGDLLNGEWYINKLTKNDFVLKLQPLIEETTILTLKKVH